MICISFIVPIFKGNKYIANIIKMVEDNYIYASKEFVCQVELILVNDNPEQKIILCYSSEIVSIRILENQKNVGIHQSRVNGLLEAKGNYICFLDQDDRISPIFLREQLSCIEEHDAVVCNGKNRSKPIYNNIRIMQRINELEDYQNGINGIVSPGQVIIRRESIPTVWTQKTMKINGADDYYLWYLMKLNNKSFAINNKILYLHSMTGKNASSDGDKMDKSVYEMVDLLEKNQYIKHDVAEHIRNNRKQWAEQYKQCMDRENGSLYLVQMLDLWLTHRDNKISIANYFVRNQIRSIAIYGLGMFGRHLYKELQESEIEVRFIIDRNREIKKLVSNDTQYIYPGEKMSDVDIIVITPLLKYQEIKDELEKKYSFQTVSLETIILSLDESLME